MNDNPFTYENLCWAAKQCMRGVAWKNGTARWRMNLLGNCRKLELEIASGKYHMGKTNMFRITSPKPRDVSAILMRDRVVHKVICHQGGLIEDMFRNAYACNCACQANKGTGWAIELFDSQLHDFYQLHGVSDGWVLELDIRWFFDSIPHDKLVEWVYHRVRRSIVRKMVREIIENHPGDTGIDLGSEVSQILANSYLTPVDYIIKQKFGIRHYVRYADNLVILVPPMSIAVLEDGSRIAIDGRRMAGMIYEGIRHAVSTLGLELNAKSSIHPLKQGVHFLGFRWRLSNSGKVERNILRSSVGRIRRRLKRLVKLYQEGRRTARQVMDSFTSWAAYAKNATSEYQIHKLQDQLQELLK